MAPRCWALRCWAAGSSSYDALPKLSRCPRNVSHLFSECRYVQFIRILREREPVCLGERAKLRPFCQAIPGSLARTGDAERSGRDGELRRITALLTEIELSRSHRSENPSGPHHDSMPSVVVQRSHTSSMGDG